jgi:hypothetical protein
LKWLVDYDGDVVADDGESIFPENLGGKNAPRWELLEKNSTSSSNSDGEIIFGLYLY